MRADSLLSIVVPTFREASNIFELAHRIDRTLVNHGSPYELIIVDDASDDGIEEKVRELSAGGLPVRILVRTEEKGLSSAVLAGFAQAKGDLLMCMDADLSHPPEKIPELTANLHRDGVEIAVGSRYMKGASTDERWSLHRLIMSKTATLLARPLTRLSDPMSGFFALRRDVYKRAQHLNPIGFKICLELIVKAHCRLVVEVPIHFSDRIHGSSKLNFREQIRYLIHLQRLYRFKLKTRNNGVRLD